MNVVYECFDCGTPVSVQYDETVTGIPETEHVGKVIEGMCLNCHSDKIWIKQG